MTTIADLLALPALASLTGREALEVIHHWLLYLNPRSGTSLHAGDLSDEQAAEILANAEVEVLARVPQDREDDLLLRIRFQGDPIGLVRANVPLGARHHRWFLGRECALAPQENNRAFQAKMEHILQPAPDDRFKGPAHTPDRLLDFGPSLTLDAETGELRARTLVPVWILATKLNQTVSETSEVLLELCRGTDGALVLLRRNSGYDLLRWQDVTPEGAAQAVRHAITEALLHQARPADGPHVMASFSPEDGTGFCVYVGDLDRRTMTNDLRIQPVRDAWLLSNKDFAADLDVKMSRGAAIELPDADSVRDLFIEESVGGVLAATVAAPALPPRAPDAPAARMPQPRHAGSLLRSPNGGPA